MCVINVASVHAHTSEGRASNSKQRINRDDTVRLIIDSDSDSDVSECEQPDSDMYDN
jgi:hypothetical protein